MLLGVECSWFDIFAQPRRVSGLPLTPQANRTRAFTLGAEIMTEAGKAGEA